MKGSTASHGAGIFHWSYLNIRQPESAQFRYDWLVVALKVGNFKHSSGSSALQLEATQPVCIYVDEEAPRETRRKLEHVGWVQKLSSMWGSTWSQDFFRLHLSAYLKTNPAWNRACSFWWHAHSGFSLQCWAETTNHQGRYWPVDRFDCGFRQSMLGFRLKPVHPLSGQPIQVLRIGVPCRRSTLLKSYLWKGL